MAAPAWLKATTTAAVGGTIFHTVTSPADEWLDLMERQTDLHRKAFAAVRALEDDPGCIQAHLFLARQAKTTALAGAHLRKAIETGNALWQPVASSQDDFAWWGEPATRPYMQALKEYGDWLVESGNESGGRRVYRTLLEMNPVDSQGIRYVVADLDGVEIDEGMETTEEESGFRM